MDNEITAFSLIQKVKTVISFACVHKGIFKNTVFQIAFIIS